MVAPVTGPFVRSTALRDYTWFGSPVKYRMYRNWYRQKKPYNLSLTYSFYVRYVVKQYVPGNPYSENDATQDNALGLAGLCYNKAYNRFVDQMHDSANWAVNLAEYRQSLDSMTSRFGQITRFVRKLHKFDYFGAAKELRLAAVPKGVSKRKSFADNFLEYHFGWEPLVKDIGASVEILQAPIAKSRRVCGKSHEHNSVRSRSDLGSIWLDRTDEGTVYVRLDATVSVSNPNLHLANQMGFVNPLVIAWELVPFSFVVDWFANVGQVLSSASDFVGLTLVSSSNTTYQRYTASNFSIVKSSGALTRGATFASAYCARSSGIGAGPTLKLRPFKGFSLTRGVTAISLLLQQLR